jgi:hypothetical protein
MCYCGNVYCLKLIERGVCKVRKDKAKELETPNFLIQETTLQPPITLALVYTTDIFISC